MLKRKTKEIVEVTKQFDDLQKQMISTEDAHNKCRQKVEERGNALTDLEFREKNCQQNLEHVKKEQEVCLVNSENLGMQLNSLKVQQKHEIEAIPKTPTPSNSRKLIDLLTQNATSSGKDAITNVLVSTPSAYNNSTSKVTNNTSIIDSLMPNGAPNSIVTKLNNELNKQDEQVSTTKPVNDENKEASQKENDNEEHSVKIQDDQTNDAKERKKDPFIGMF